MHWSAAGREEAHALKGAGQKEAEAWEKLAKSWSGPLHRESVESLASGLLSCAGVVRDFKDFIDGVEVLMWDGGRSRDSGSSGTARGQSIESASSASPRSPLNGIKERTGVECFRVSATVLGVSPASVRLIHTAVI